MTDDISVHDVYCRVCHALPGDPCVGTPKGKRPGEVLEYVHHARRDDWNTRMVRPGAYLDAMGRVVVPPTEGSEPG